MSLFTHPHVIPNLDDFYSVMHQKKILSVFMSIQWKWKESSVVLDPTDIT